MALFGNDWDRQLEAEVSKQYFSDVREFVKKERSSYTVYPPEGRTFAALRYTSYDNVKVVIVGQDPYINENQANGLAFAVSKKVVMPPSLKNIFKEIESDLNVSMTGKSPELTGWAHQGVLLLNASLTVRAGQSNSHQMCGWQQFTDSVIAEVGKREKPAVFILWGAFAGRKASLIGQQHCIIKSAHPSPLSAYNGFFGSRPFSRANEFLVKNGITPVDWTDTEYEEIPSYYRRTGSIIQV